MKKTILLTASVFLLAFSACKKDKDELNKDCEDFPELTSNGIDVDYKYAPDHLPQSTNPCFNPNNPQELCFLKAVGFNNGTPISEFWKVNISTGKQERIVAAEGISQPDWGKNGWILFDKIGGLIWKVKSNGDSLTQLTFQYENYHPKWNNRDNTFYDRLMTGNLGTSGIVERKPTGEIIRQINKLDHPTAQEGNISPDGNKIVSKLADGEKNYGLDLFEFPDFKPQLLYPLEAGKGVIFGVAWHPDNRHVFWTNGNGLYKTDIVSKQTWQLKSSCDSRIYLFLAVSPDGQTVAVGRSDTWLVDKYTLDGEVSIYLMDDNGYNERKLEL